MSDEVPVEAPAAEEVPTIEVPTREQYERLARRVVRIDARVEELTRIVTRLAEMLGPLLRVLRPPPPSARARRGPRPR